ncbi:MAG: tRNA threonylcarbamoyladenosine dehydratase [Clostridia bacterium]|nr:tRNA threonylcarbamoyladenosine dehydratase [Clostridia bacterium]
MDKAFFRTSLVIGEENIHKLSNSIVWVFGVGGVGGFAVEALARAGVGHIRAVDMDVVDITNINRQLIATRSTVGAVKVDEMKKRCLDINPSIDFCAVHKKFSAENESEFDFTGADYIVDAIDMVTSKILLIEKAQKCGVPIISSMGTGNKTDATKLTVSDIYSTEGDPLARVMRRELKKRGVDKLKVVYSSEKPIKQTVCEEGKSRPITASVPWVPPVAGFIIAGEVIKDVCGI